MRFDQNTLHTGPADGQRERKRREKRISEALSSGHLGRPLLVSASSHKKSQKGCFSERWLARDSQHPLVLQERIYISSLWSLSGIRGHAGTAWLTALVWTLWDSGASCERSTPTASVCLKTTQHIDFFWQIVSCEQKAKVNRISDLKSISIGQYYILNTKGHRTVFLSRISTSTIIEWF